MDRPDMTAIYNEYHDKVMGYICARLSSKEDAEDLCQDVFEKVHAKLGGFDPGKAAVGTWIYSITRNRVIDYYRLNRQAAELDEELPEEGSIDDSLLNDETLEELAAALEKLPAELRQIIVLRYYDGLPLTEIAKRMNLSYGAVKLRHNKALQLLRENMP